jgi:hypothetical protein
LTRRNGLVGGAVARAPRTSKAPRTPAASRKSRTPAAQPPKTQDISGTSNPRWSGKALLLADAGGSVYVIPEEAAKSFKVADLEGGDAKSRVDALLMSAQKVGKGVTGAWLDLIRVFNDA